MSGFLAGELRSKDLEIHMEVSKRMSYFIFDKKEPDGTHVWRPWEKWQRWQSSERSESKGDIDLLVSPRLEQGREPGKFHLAAELKFLHDTRKTWKALKDDLDRALDTLRLWKNEGLVGSTSLAIVNWAYRPDKQIKRSSVLGRLWDWTRENGAAVDCLKYFDCFDSSEQAIVLDWGDSKERKPRRFKVCPTDQFPGAELLSDRWAGA